MEKILIRLAIFFSFYILGAYGTTDIVRLLRDSDTDVNDPACYCPSCKSRLGLHEQIPVISYMMSRGRCRHCGSKISVSDILPEVFLSAAMIFVTVLFHFSSAAFFLTFAIYELIKLLCILICGKKKTAFIHNLRLSIRNNLFIFSLIGFLFFLEQIQ